MTTGIEARRRRSPLRVHLSALALLASLVWSAPALAQGKDAAAAEALFREGRALSDAGDTGGACAKFRESNRLDPAVGTLFNLADCEERLGHLAQAWTLFDEVAQRLPEADKRRAPAAARAKALEPRLPKLRVRLAATAPEGSRVARDGVELGSASLGTPLPLDPGSHVVVASAPGHADREFRVLLREREYQTLEVQPGPPELAAEPVASQPSVAPAPPRPPQASSTLGYVIAGAGVAGFVTAGIAGAFVLQARGVVNEHCDAAKRCDAQGLDAAENGKLLGIVTTAGLVVGAAGVGAGLYLVLSAGSVREPSAGNLALTGSF